MRVLEARFHPLSIESSEVIVIGRVICRDDGAMIEPAETLVCDAVSATMLSKLRYLVNLGASDPFRRLSTLNSRFWSFVELSPAVLFNAQRGLGTGSHEASS